MACYQDNCPTCDGLKDTRSVACIKCRSVVRVTKCPSCGGKKDHRAIECQPCRFKNRHPRQMPIGKQKPNFGGYLVLGIDGKRIYHHRHVMEKKLGRKLSSKEHVHHKNGNRLDNRLCNLEVLSDSEHHKHHMTPERAKRMSRLAHKARWGYASVI